MGTVGGEGIKFIYADKVLIKRIKESIDSLKKVIILMHKLTLVND